MKAKNIWMIIQQKSPPLHNSHATAILLKASHLY